MKLDFEWMNVLIAMREIEGRGTYYISAIWTVCISRLLF